MFPGTLYASVRARTSTDAYMRTRLHKTWRALSLLNPLTANPAPRFFWPGTICMFSQGFTRFSAQLMRPERCWVLLARANMLVFTIVYKGLWLTVRFCACAKSLTCHHCGPAASGSKKCMIFTSFSEGCSLIPVLIA